MKFSIVTPSFPQFQLAQALHCFRCRPAGVELEHIVQDACSDDGTQDWLPQDRRVQRLH